MLRDLHDGVLTLTLDRPEVRNALDGETVALLHAAYEEAEADETTRAVVLRANGPAFCAGGDVSVFKAMMRDRGGAGLDSVSRNNRTYGALLERIVSSSVPTLAVVAGAAVGGGVGLAAANDFVLVRADATFRMPELTIGIPPAQIAPFVADRIGRSATFRLALLARKIGAQEAVDIGLADTLASDDAALELLLHKTLAAILACEPQSARATKRILFHEAYAQRAGTLNIAAAYFAQAFRDGHATEGLAALQEKRKPRWTP